MMKTQVKHAFHAGAALMICMLSSSNAMASGKICGRLGGVAITENSMILDLQPEGQWTAVELFRVPVNLRENVAALAASAMAADALRENVAALAASAMAADAAAPNPPLPGSGRLRFCVAADPIDQTGFRTGRFFTLERGGTVQP
jgi:hypothetical protein